MLSTVALVVSGWTASNAQVAEPEVPGDHFSLEGALELFKQSASPEEFEKMLNSPDSKVNNLDLNGDGYIDYVRVIDRYEGNIHVFILQAVISDRETQDVAVIELEKLSNGRAVLQIIGDEDIYGVTTIIEPTREVRTYAGTRTTPTVVNVWTWPSVQYIYSPYYSHWVSPWGWHSRPVWYRRWRPVAYVHYYPIWRPYRPYYAVCETRRVVYAREIYRPHRSTSVVVVNRHREQLTRYRDDHRHQRTRSNDRRYTTNGRSVEGRSDNGRYTTNSRSVEGGGIDRRRDDANVTRRASGQRESVTPRSVSRDRRISTDLRQNNDRMLRRTESPGESSTRTRTRQNRTSPVIQGSPSQSRNAQMRSAPATRSVPSDIRRSTPNVRQRQSAPAPTVRQQMNRPSSVERSQPAPRPNVRQSAPQQNRSVSPPAGRSYRQPTSRPPSVSTGRSSAPRVQQSHTPGRSTGATRSPDGRRGRQ